ncbi:30S ribosomal protein S20 [Patescibacteria group bacterium]|nr:30S ribosomal protein S20 [Patescibacteria group bacterium]
MPIIESAKKKNRRDQRRRALNLKKKITLKKTVKAAREDMSPANLLAAQKNLDKAAKQGLIHHNKANRLKSRLAKKAKA